MDYELVWQDLFQTDGKPDPSIWVFETGGHGFGNHEAQYYTDRLKNAFVKDGILSIVAYKEPFENCAYTSAKLTTYNKKHIQHGRVEIMAKVPKGEGTWPAIWMLSERFKQGVPWPDCGEIDLLEHVGHHPGHVHFSLHSSKSYFHLNNQLTKVSHVPDAQDEFHEYRMDWDPDHISFYIDQKLQEVFHRSPDATDETWPFNQPFYLILNIALGGTWGGPIDDQIFPTAFQFKYVKVYQRGTSHV